MFLADCDCLFAKDLLDCLAEQSLFADFFTIDVDTLCHCVLDEVNDLLCIAVLEFRTTDDCFDFCKVCCAGKCGELFLVDEAVDAEDTVQFKFACKCFVISVDEVEVLREV